MPRYKNPALSNLAVFEPLEYAEFVKLYYDKVADNEFRNLLLFTFLIGPRPHEAYVIKRENVEYERNYLIFKLMTLKGGIKRIIYIPIINNETEALAKFVLEKKFPKEPVFKEMYMYKNPRDYFIKRCYENKVGRVYDGVFYPFSFYFFRHNILTLLSQNGADMFDLLIYKGASLRFLFKSLGHYLHFSQQRAIKIANILKKIMKK
ncbi:MAG: hypothetical protein QXV63_02100 [Candidatus Aenigmatarchaeota archaeon]